MEPWIWAIIIAVLLIVEFTTMGLVSIWFALGSVVGFVMSFFGLDWYWEVVASLITGFVLLASTRKFVVKFLQIKAVSTNADMMIGKETKLLEDMDENKRGSVRLNGTTWTAASEKEIAQGSKVRVTKLEGNTVWVEEVLEIKKKPAPEVLQDEKKAEKIQIDTAPAKPAKAKNKK